ncbi:hypothetical protein LP416_05310 [Polaromonas sp. P2-4]|nr:hypothetical protein LP416_05310 [Polaromonas sp. P2-4]
MVTVDQHGNTSAASIPLALDASVRSGKIKKATPSCWKAWAEALPGVRCFSTTEMTAFMHRPGADRQVAV